MAHGRHRKPEDHNKAAAVVTTGALSLAGIAAFGGTANAAPEDAWDRIAECESNQRWDLPYGDNGRSSGGLQFQPASWSDALAQLERDGIDTSSFPQGPGHQAYKATKAQQILAGEALLKLQGPGAWACNSIVGGPLSGYSGGDYSRYQGGGGPAPAPDPEPPAPAPKPDPDPVQPVPGDSHPSAKDDGCVHSTHTVEPGDTLYGITKAHTGNGALDNWEPLYEANRDVVGSDPDLIFPGQVLDLPWADTDHAPAEEAPAPAPEPEPEPEAPAAPAPAGGYSAPLDGVGPSSNGYGNPNPNYTLGFHTGTDFTAPQGTPVKAVADGKVIAPDGSSAYGINVKVAHNDGTYSLYAHLSGTDVFEGQEVSAGQQIGSVGSTGASTGPHLHLEIRVTPSFGLGNFIDPVVWLASKGITL